MPHDPQELFRSTAPYYARYRLGYPDEFFRYLVERFGLDGTQHALDLGCGTGQIAVPLGPHVAQVIAIDPEPTMLLEAKAATGVPSNIEWIESDSSHLTDLGLPTFDLVTIGAAFHWMNRDATLRILDGMVASSGGIVLASGGPPGERTPPPWDDVIAEVRTRFLGPERRAGSGTYSHPPETHLHVLGRSAFSDVATARWTWVAERDLDSLVGVQFSYSYSAPALFHTEERRLAFEDALRSALAAHFPSGTFRETVLTEALIATRP